MIDSPTARQPPAAVAADAVQPALREVRLALQLAARCSALKPTRRVGRRGEVEVAITTSPRGGGT